MPPSPYSYSFQAMGSDCQLTLYAEDERKADQAADLTMAEVWRIENKYSRYVDGNALSDINRAALAGGKVDVDDETAGLLNYAFAAFQLSAGLFDVSSGVLRRVWDFSSGNTPSQSAIEQILPFIGLGKATWTSPQLHFLHSGMELDFGGIGKEYAVDRGADICRSMGFQSGLLDLGGDIRVLGPHPDGSPWEIGIRHPRKPDVSLGNIRLASGAVATSGDYERYIEVAGKRYCHILNPLTGWPVAGLASVTIVAEQCLLAGTLSTIAMLKEEAGKKWLEDFGVQHCWVDGELRVGGNIQLRHSGEAGMAG
ncbi:MAG: FAD:protein FMN transferase [Gallionella sp.]|nr:FAD:protein FMN transferase [Gallionella sp.]